MIADPKHYTRPQQRVRAYCLPRVERDGRCWLWSMATNSQGHPVATIEGQHSTSVRRWAWETWHQQGIGDLWLVSECGRGLCVSPLCLCPMTIGMAKVVQAERGSFMSPAFRRACQVRGRRNSELTPELVARMRAKRQAGDKLPALAKEFGVALSVTSRVCRGESWAIASHTPFGAMISSLT